MIDPAQRPGLESADVPQAFRSRLALLLVRTAERVVLDGQAALEAELQISARDYTALAVISEDQPSSQQELAGLMAKAPALCVSMLDDLEAAGLVERVRDPKDRRRSVVSLTAQGRAKLAEADAIAARVESEVMVGLTAEERELLLATLGRSARPSATTAA